MNYSLIMLGMMIMLALALPSPEESDKPGVTKRDSVYCDMVEIWNSQYNVPKEERSGWPPYRGDDFCPELKPTAAGNEQQTKKMVR